MTVVGFSKPERVSRLLDSLSVEIPQEFWDRAGGLLPDQAVWLDH
jgi:hypothetical protein